MVCVVQNSLKVATSEIILMSALHRPSLKSSRLFHNAQKRHAVILIACDNKL